MASENSREKETWDVATPEIAPPEPAESNNSREIHTVYIEDAAAPRVAPPKAWNSRKPPGGTLPAKAEQPEGSKDT